VFVAGQQGTVHPEEVELLATRKVFTLKMMKCWKLVTVLSKEVELLDTRAVL
jgi:hypothetical protein